MGTRPQAGISAAPPLKLLNLPSKPGDAEARGSYDAVLSHHDLPGPEEKIMVPPILHKPKWAAPVPRISTCKDGLPSPQRDSSEHSEMSSEKLHSDSRPSLAAEHTGKCLGQAARELWSLVDNDDLTLGGLLKSHAD
eukprot:CAMPEP_0184303410 /NCGR_PEP_ID=MMETSP1049-20130417/13161_1 /TAXON_ID=77928 /ORGANISM="Proteomonas sulcata, Strain CCMP704" /LENGTH=136 /DNA_ID=CAMNT_0026614945 /DNA_START=67 /DNA_END=477 /DNA_ORIENTATION=+